METMTGRFDQALAFATVAELGSFTRAAERLGVSKAHLSKQVSDLEVVLGVRLMQRTTRRLNLTDAGRLYLGYATRMRDLLLDGERAVSAARSEVDGLIRLSAPTSFGDSFLVDLLDDFRQRHPRIVFDVDLSIMRRDLIGDGYDFAFRATRTLDPSLIARSLGVMREIVVGSPALLARHGLEHVETPAQLSQLEALRNGHFRDEGEWLLQRGDESMAVPIRGTFAINHFIAMRRAALKGIGIARLPRYLLIDDLCAGRLLHLLPDWQVPPTPVSLVYPSREHLPARSRAFRDFVVAWFEQPERADLLR
jgi:DNA-binding transcriptional LysR family regulator